MNKQPAEKPINKIDGSLAVHSVFHTIQGEGPFTGYPAVFVRLSGCNLQCPGCDTDYTSKRTSISAEALFSYVEETAPNGLDNQLVVITGGEPFRQNILPFCGLLLSNNARVQIETNGTLQPQNITTWENTKAWCHSELVIVCSPKTPTINPEIANRADAFKYVLDHKSIDPADGLPVSALELETGKRVARPPRDNPADVYLQPYDTGNVFQTELNKQACVRSCLKFGYIMQLQIHKLIGVL